MGNCHYFTVGHFLNQSHFFKRKPQVPVQLCVAYTPTQNLRFKSDFINKEKVLDFEKWQTKKHNDVK